MQNVKVTRKGSKLTLTVDLAEDGVLSASGKSHVIATTRGNQEIDAGERGTVFLGLNLYQKVA